MTVVMLLVILKPIGLVRRLPEDQVLVQKIAVTVFQMNRSAVVIGVLLHQTELKQDVRPAPDMLVLKLVVIPIRQILRPSPVLMVRAPALTVAVMEN